MNAEFKLYVKSVCEEAKAKEAATSKINLRNSVGSVLDWIESFGPYWCDLRPVRNVCAAVRNCCKRKEVIGFHGLA